MWNCEKLNLLIKFLQIIITYYTNIFVNIEKKVSIIKILDFLS